MGFVAYSLAEIYRRQREVDEQKKYLIAAAISDIRNSVKEYLALQGLATILFEEGVEIGVATIYRVLTQFEQADILLRHHFESGKAVYELNKGDHHDHIVCVKCGKVTEFHNPTIESLQGKIAEDNGYRIVDHALYLYGVCGDCQQKHHL